MFVCLTINIITPLSYEWGYDVTLFKLSYMYSTPGTIALRCSLTYNSLFIMSSSSGEMSSLRQLRR